MHCQRCLPQTKFIYSDPFLFPQYRAARNRPLQSWQKMINRLISRVRYKVERAFGTMKRQFGLNRARYFGVRKTEAQFAYAAINMNLLKAANKLKLTINPERQLQARCA
ncbi:MAG: transposase [Nevskiales bacterium]|nr:transposase [Nevskiales bacterium]